LAVLFYYSNITEPAQFGSTEHDRCRWQRKGVRLWRSGQNLKAKICRINFGHRKSKPRSGRRGRVFKSRHLDQTAPLARLR